jgi:methionine-S-sulfoxide reductase
MAAESTVPTTKIETAIFAGGCFWCIEPPFDAAEGVVKTTVGYTGGHVANPTYEQVTRKKTGHYEAIEVAYDPAKTSYEKLLTIFWKNIDPTDAGGQFADRGQSYQTAIFYRNETQKKTAEASKAAVAKKLGQPIPTAIIAASAFYPAEDYHQEYYKKNAVHYNAYKYGSGRPARLKEIWGGD